MRIWHFSDTHGYHGLLDVPKDINVAVFSGDASLSRNPYINSGEMDESVAWFKQIGQSIIKIYVAGNHDSSIEKRIINKQTFLDAGIIYLEDSELTINVDGRNIKFYGTPYTPTYNNWSFMKSRDKMSRVWDGVPEDTNVLISHGPPKGILDLTETREHILEQTGCSAMYKKIEKLKNLECVLFGHIHDCQNCKNRGIMIRNGITYSNGSVVKDGKFGYLTSNGNIIEI